MKHEISFIEEKKMGKIKVLDEKFREAKDYAGACYGISEDGDVELYTPYDTAYPVITKEEIQKLAEILEKEKRRSNLEGIDLKGRYQRRAEGLALSEHDKAFDELGVDTQFEIYNRAVILVGEELQLATDDLREEMRVEEG